MCLFPQGWAACYKTFRGDENLAAKGRQVAECPFPPIRNQFNGIWKITLAVAKTNSSNEWRDPNVC